MPKLPPKAPASLAAKALVAGGITAAFLVGVGVVPLFFGAGCDFSGTNETVVRQITAPDGKHTAVIVERGGDATVGFFRMVVLCDGSDGCSMNKENIVASDNAQGIFNLGWAANDKLVVYYSPSFTKFRGKADAKNGVNIEYVPQGK